MFGLKQISRKFLRPAALAVRGSCERKCICGGVFGFLDWFGAGMFGGRPALIVVFEAFDKMKQLLAARPGGVGNVEWKFHGVTVCCRGWRALHAMGALTW